MRPLSLAKSGLNKLRSQNFELKSSDIEGSVKFLPPGQWCFFRGIGDELWAGFVNPLMEEKFSCAHVVVKMKPEEAEIFSPELFIRMKISEAHQRRSRFSGYEKNSRIFYGVSDGLPGLIIDQFENAAIVQINTAGIDRFRESIKQFVSDLLKTPALLLDNSKYREKEFLPTFEKEDLPDLLVQENGLHYKIRSEVLQKVGFYYDHRENRLQLLQLLTRMKRKPLNGVDLFSYAGAWGMTALRAGAERLEFVDQGDFEEEVNASLELNGLQGRGAFFRTDVFRHLDSAISAGKTYDLILCDPPAFAKSALQKAQALEGYSKLHRKVLKIASRGALAAFSSCTHYVSHDEFQKNILESAGREGRKLQLVYSGMQGFDHPVTSLTDKSNYIKSYFYIVE